MSSVEPSDTEKPSTMYQMGRSVPQPLSPPSAWQPRRLHTEMKEGLCSHTEVLSVPSSLQKAMSRDT